MVIIALLTVAIRTPLLNIPFERDEGEYAYIAWRLGHHELPYRDWIDQKPPGVFWVYRLALSLPLDPVCAVHLTGLLFSLATACALFFLAGRFMTRGWALVAGAMFVLLSAGPLLNGTAANTELFMLLPLIGSQILFLFTVADGRCRFMILTGVLIGMATSFKQVAAVNWPFLVLMYPILADGEKRLGKTIAFAAWSAAGMMAVWVLIGLYFFLRHGFQDFIYNVFTHNLEYVNAMPLPVRMKVCLNTLTVLFRDQVLIWLLSLAGLIALVAGRRRKQFLFFAGWMITSWIGVSASGYFFPHYFQQISPVLCLTAVMGAEALAGGLGALENIFCAAVAGGIGHQPRRASCHRDLSLSFCLFPGGSGEQNIPGQPFCRNA